MKRDWRLAARMRQSGFQMISCEDSLGHYSYDEWTSNETSDYGDPEEALIEHQTPTSISESHGWWDRALAELRKMCACLLPEDRIMIVARHNGCIQEDVAAMIGMETQVGVCNREKRLRTWARYVLQRRMMLRAVREPKAWEHFSHRRDVWHAIIWEHKTTTEIAEELEINQSTIHGWWQQAVRDICAEADPRTCRLVYNIQKRIELWQRPRRSRRTKERRRSRMADIELSLLIYEIDLACALWRLDHPDCPIRIDPRTRPSGLGIDLSRKEVVAEVRKLFGRFGLPRLLRTGLEPEEALADVLRDIEVRNQGKCPFDPELGAFSTYVVRVINQSLSRHISRSLRKRPPTICSLESMDANLDRMLIDNSAWSEEEYDAAERRVFSVIERHAGEIGLRYARVRLGEGTLAKTMTLSERRHVADCKDAILAELRS